MGTCRDPEPETDWTPALQEKGTWRQPRDPLGRPILVQMLRVPALRYHIRYEQSRSYPKAENSPPTPASACTAWRSSWCPHRTSEHQAGTRGAIQIPHDSTPTTCSRGKWPFASRGRSPALSRPALGLVASESTARERRTVHWPHACMRALPDGQCAGTSLLPQRRSLDDARRSITFLCSGRWPAEQRNRYKALTRMDAERRWMADNDDGLQAV